MDNLLYYISLVWTDFRVFFYGGKEMNSLSDLWQEIMKYLSGKITQSALATWFSDCEIVEMDDCRFVIHTPNAFKRSIINDRYIPFIKEALYNLLSADFDIEVLAGMRSTIM